MEDISHAHIVSIVYKLITSAEDSYDLFIGFDRDRRKWQQELTNIKNIKGKYPLRIMLKDVFGFAEHQEKATYDSGYKLTLTRNKDDAVLNEAEVIADGRIKIDNIHWYVPH